MTTSDFLSRIVSVKEEEISSLYAQGGLIAFQNKAAAATQDHREFGRSISDTSFALIAELKKASPSKGLINPNFDPVSIAKQYEASGATCLSVLTEVKYFLGDPAYILQVKEAVELPILRKDFIIDPIQVYESVILGADAILLIKRLLDDDQCELLVTLAESLGLDVLLEVHDEKELDAVLGLSGHFLIGINNRNLETFEVDMNLASSLLPKIRARRSDCLVVAESGYTTDADMRRLSDDHFSAVLVGEGLVKHPEMLAFFNEN